MTPIYTFEYFNNIDDAWKLDGCSMNTDDFQSNIEYVKQNCDDAVISGWVRVQVWIDNTYIMCMMYDVTNDDTSAERIRKDIDGSLENHIALQQAITDGNWTALEGLL